MLRRFAALSASALLCLVGTAGVAEARTDSLYTPSAVVLSISKGADASSSTVLRAVTLSCAPTAHGTHPAPEAACAELKAGSQDGAFGGLLALPAPDRMCPQHFDPVTVTVDGVWEGSRTSWQYTFGNACAMGVGLNGGAAFAF
ncbi:MULTISPECIES: subtilase-type protease inhibitor [unclassified Streptomyces]|uniref:subtilase-type protease inhibitor n=1 Tax=unclassified Streptomyces TaxID=2593676 RepID=UPI00094024A1|nr:MULTISPECIES: subtilase-type protease inhibitor [unclassified Streptomyces]MCD2462226.1 subtilase-type protease inhibitor [Streptomyces sp. MBT42]OKJ63700.1 serine protease [Streptomyces sp. CB02009]